MPKFRMLSATIVALLALSGCSADPTTETAAPVDRPLVLTTFTVIADMVEQIAGDAVEVASITKVGAEIHGYEPTPSDLTRAASADLIFDNGLGLERWFEQFLAHADAPHVVLTDGIEPIDIAAGDDKGRPNPHAWMSPVAGQQYVANITAALSELVPERAAAFEAAAAQYSAELDAVAQELADAVATIPEKERVLVTCEGAFSYLARDLALEEVYLWPVNSDAQGTPKQVSAAIERVRESGARAVFCESTVNDGAMRQVAREADAKFAGTLYVDSLSDADGPVPTYLDLLRHDVRTITEGLTK